MSKKIKIKYGKGQSAMGMVAGILFCIIGVVMVIPVFGFFGIVWTLFALGITILNGINAFSDKGMISREIIIDEENKLHSDSRQLQQKESVQERLKLVERLYAEGSITKEEYDQKRKKILDEI